VPHKESSTDEILVFRDNLQAIGTAYSQTIRSSASCRLRFGHARELGNRSARRPTVCRRDYGQRNSSWVKWPIPVALAVGSKARQARMSSCVRSGKSSRISRSDIQRPRYSQHIVNRDSAYRGNRAFHPLPGFDSNSVLVIHNNPHLPLFAMHLFQWPHLQHNTQGSAAAAKHCPSGSVVGALGGRLMMS